MRFAGIRQKIFQVGFDDFYQAGSTSRFHPMNIVAESRILNLQFWVCAEGGYGVSETYHISERPLDNYHAPTQRINFKTQTEVIAGLEQIRQRITDAKRSKSGKVNLNMDKERYKMEYNITMERIQRVAVTFTADNDEEALEKAAEINRTATPADFEGGDEEHDYALCDGAGSVLVDWS